MYFFPWGLLRVIITVGGNLNIGFPNLDPKLFRISFLKIQFNSFIDDIIIL